MASILLKNVTGVVNTEIAERVSIKIADGMIDAIGDGAPGNGETIDCSGLFVLPGFIDAHIHGAVGVDVNAADTDGLIEVARFLAANGVTAWVPTLVPDSDEAYARAIAAIDGLMSVQAAHPIAQAVGVHYEGVFANEHMCGALRPRFFKSFDGRQLADIPRLRAGSHMMTFAPEVSGGIELAAELLRQGWIGSIGHTKADAATLDAAFAAGTRHMTHFYNAMTGLHHRDLGAVGWALTNPEVTFDIIADGIHVHPKMLELACIAKSPQKVTLISDSVAPTGMGDGVFEIWGERVGVTNGRTKNERGSIAGSVITMLDAFNQARAIGFGLVDASRMASANPAALLGIEGAYGSIEEGKRADIIALDDAGRIGFTIIGGQIA